MRKTHESGGPDRHSSVPQPHKSNRWLVVSQRKPMRPGNERSWTRVSVRFRSRPAATVPVVGNLGRIDQQCRARASRRSILESDARAMHTRRSTSLSLSRPTRNDSSKSNCASVHGDSEICTASSLTRGPKTSSRDSRRPTHRSVQTPVSRKATPGRNRMPITCMASTGTDRTAFRRGPDITQRGALTLGTSTITYVHGSGNSWTQVPDAYARLKKQPGDNLSNALTGWRETRVVPSITAANTWVPQAVIDRRYRADSAFLSAKFMMSHFNNSRPRRLR